MQNLFAGWFNSDKPSFTASLKFKACFVLESFVVLLAHLRKFDEWFKHCLLVHSLKSLLRQRKCNHEYSCTCSSKSIAWNTDDSATVRCSGKTQLCFYDLYRGRFLYCDPAARTTSVQMVSRAQQEPVLCAWGQESMEGWTGWGNWLSDTAESRRSTTHTRIMLGVSCHFIYM